MISEKQLKHQVEHWKREQHFKRLDEKHERVVRAKIAQNKDLNLYDRKIWGNKKKQLCFKGKPVKKIFVWEGDVRVKVR
jgi:hypothetical protein